MDLHELIIEIPQDYSEVSFADKRYSLTRKDFNQGRSIKVFARELGGTDFISFNYYLTEGGPLLKPCEMPLAKVEQFLRQMAKVGS
ncbi:MAG: peptide methionine sulfoxide reductase [Bacteroidota bacterium]